MTPWSRTSGVTLRIEIAVEYVVKVAFLTVFRYELSLREVWSNGMLQSVRATTNNNGKTEFMSAERRDGSLLVNGSRVKPYRPPNDALIASLSAYVP